MQQSLKIKSVDTFLKLIYYVRKRKTFRDDEHLKAWMLTVVINRGKSILNLAWNRRTEGMDSVAEMAASEQESGHAYEYVMRLPEKYRIAVQLFYYEQLTTEQIAEYMKTKPATVKECLEDESSVVTDEQTDENAEYQEYHCSGPSEFTLVAYENGYFTISETGIFYR